MLSEVSVLFGGWGTPQITQELLIALPRLKAVFYAGGSVRHLPCETFWQRDIVLSSAWGANAIPVAEFTLAAILFCLKDVFRLGRSIHENGAWPERPNVSGAYHTTVGLISMGMTARVLRDRLRAFDLNVISYDPFLDEAEAKRLDVERVTLEELFTRADVVSLHAPLRSETEGMIGRSLFARMKKGASFINTARGAIVRENEMIDVLKERPDLFAVLDVTHPEPPLQGSPLYSLPNVFMTPHMAGSWGGELTRMSVFMADEFERYLGGQPLLWQITREQIDRMA
jgi:phosphoglycerate dehydrogenase-like enzyme